MLNCTRYSRKTLLLEYEVGLDGILLEYMYSNIMNEAGLLSLSRRIGQNLQGGEVIELVGDVGAGKTTFTRGLARGLEINEDIQSPTFTISRVYEASRGLRLVHYDFYRLTDAGIMAMELDEAIHDSNTITVIEWGEVVAGVLPRERTTITITPTSETMRSVQINNGGDRLAAIMKDRA